MALDPDDFEVAKTWLETHCRNMACPCCGTNAWTIGDISTMLPLQGNAVQLGGTVTPTVSLACTNCGYMRFFSAVIMGLAEPGAPPAAP
jgi:predicted nucleic-acid-binding Zn-ribbon protein